MQSLEHYPPQKQRPSGRFVQFGSYKPASDLSHPHVSGGGIDGDAK